MSSEHQILHELGINMHPSPEENRKNVNLATWLGLVGFTFFYGSSVASNVYLRSWSPEKFKLPTGFAYDIPYYATLVLLIIIPFLFLAGRYFKKREWKKLNRTFIVLIPLFVIYADLCFWLMHLLLMQNAQVRTSYFGIAILQFGLACLSLILIAVNGWYSTYKDRDPIRKYFPASMNVWLYTIFSAIVVLFITDIVSFGQFADWCGTKITGLGK
jgi:uncharacterized membrane protein YozB (DUF420 family)